MPSEVGPIFLLSSERSGTNLLRRRLTEWQSSVFGPSPAHHLKHLYQGVAYYGDLKDDKNFLSLIDDALALCFKHFAPWKVELTREGIFEDYRATYGERRGVILLSHLLYTRYAEAKGFVSYFCKDNHLFDYAVDLNAQIPNACFVYLYRDPRDYVLSQRNRLLQTSSVVANAMLWREEQIKCISILANPAFEGRVVRLSYEEFISNERACLKRIADKFGLALRTDSDGNVHDDADRVGVQEWENLDRPTMSENQGKYKKAMSAGMIRTIEAIVWNQMRFLGYEPENAERPKVGMLKRVLDPVWGDVKFLMSRKFKKREFDKGRKERKDLMNRLAGRVR